jgi:CRISPR/Cas system CSM-associated protein Csm3 (group 7 of RAMP superfamily)
MNRFDKSREIIERIVIEGDLVLLTPTSLGNGDSDGITDMSLLLDEIAGSALLTGTSIAGALRNYLRERERGFEKEEDNSSICRKLFGWHKDEDEGAQSLLIIDDSISDQLTTELRDGVRIEGKTRTAYIDDKGKGAKFDIELLEAGTTFKLRFELLISQEENKEDLIAAFATALQGFEKSEIHLGARKRRGYGECKVEKWKAKRFVLTGEEGLVSWLKNDFSNSVETSQIAEAFNGIYSGENLSLNISDQREYFELTACFALDGSMLIRSGSKLSNVGEKGQPDTVHLRSKHKDKGSVPVVSGTSLAGVLRHRAMKICNTIADGRRGKRFVEKIFGVDMEELKERNKNKGTKEQPYASRLEVNETFIENTSDLVQTRVKIDRFTGGAFEGALFDAAPVFAKDDKLALTITLKLRNPKCCEIGLLLLLLKDLWTSDLAIGGESSIGRGRLKGISASLYNRKNDSDSWKISLKETGKIETQVEGSLPNNETGTKFLNDLVGKLRAELEKDNANN